MKNSLYNLIGAGIKLFIGLLTIPVLIRTVGIEEYGLWTLVSSAIEIVRLTEGGISMSTTVFLARDLADGDEDSLAQTLTVVTCAMLFLSGFAGLFMWFGADFMASFFSGLNLQQKTTAIGALHFGALALWSKLLQQTMVGIEQAYQQYGLMNSINTIQFIFTNVGLLCIAYFGGKSVELMAWTAVVATIGLIVHLIVCFRLLKSVNIRFLWDRVKSQAIAKYSLLSWVSQLGSVMFSQGDRLIVGGVLGTESLGIYAAITNITYQINYLSGLSVQPLLPSIASDYQQQVSGKENSSSLIDRIKTGCQINTAISLGVGTILLSLSPSIGQIVIGKYFTASHVLPFQIAIFIYCIFSLNAVGYFTCLAVNLVNKCTIFQLISGSLSLVLMYIGAIQFGLMGAVIGNIGFILTIGLNSVATDKIIGKKFIWIEWIYLPVIFFILSIAIDSLIAADNLLLKLSFLFLKVSGLSIYFYLELKPNLRLS
jgi:O-antigen/teichoic acid export membrane protein